MAMYEIMRSYLCDALGHVRHEAGSTAALATVHLDTVVNQVRLQLQGV